MVECKKATRILMEALLFYYTKRKNLGRITFSMMTIRFAVFCTASRVYFDLML